MRETLDKVAEKSEKVGITPAYAGNTQCGTLIRARDWDHPRVCGKHDSVKAPFLITSGSPPRMRETLEDAFVQPDGKRITPAYAGNTKAAYQELFN